MFTEVCVVNQLFTEELLISLAREVERKATFLALEIRSIGRETEARVKTGEGREREREKGVREQRS